MLVPPFLPERSGAVPSITYWPAKRDFGKVGGKKSEIIFLTAR